MRGRRRAEILKGWRDWAGGSEELVVESRLMAGAAMGLGLGEGRGGGRGREDHHWDKEAGGGGWQI